MVGHPDRMSVRDEVVVSPPVAPATTTPTLPRRRFSMSPCPALRSAGHTPRQVAKVPRRGLGALCLLALVFAAFVVWDPVIPGIAGAAPEPEAAPGAAVGAAEGDGYVCNPLGTATCSLPWPTNFATRADAGSPTGLRVDVSDAMFSPELIAHLPGAERPAAIYDGTSGFSPMGPIMFEFPGPLDRESIHRPDSVVVLNARTGERVAIQAQYGELAYDDAVPTQMVKVWPRVTFEFGQRYVAIITDDLKLADGSPVPLETKLVNAQFGDPESPLTQWARARQAEVATSGIDPARIRQMTDFTVRDRAETAGPVEEILDETWAGDVPIRINAVHDLHGVNSMDYAVEGEVMSWQLRGADGVMNLNSREPLWLKFDLMVPTAARSRQVPVYISGHSLTLNRNQARFSWPSLATEGYAVIAIDQPHHGSRIDQDGGDLTTFQATERAAWLVSAGGQSLIDHLRLLRAVETTVSSIDQTGPAGVPDGHPDMDSQRTVYEGVSLGAVIGMPFVFAAPTLDAAITTVGAAGWMYSVANSMLAETLHADKVAHSAKNGSEAEMLMGMLQHQLDPVDAPVFADRVRAPRADTGRQIRLLLNHSWGDHVVFWYGGERASALAGVPYVGPGSPPAGSILTKVAGDPSGGWAATGYRDAYGEWMGPTLNGFMPHVSFVNPDIVRIVGEFRHRFVRENW